MTSENDDDDAQEHGGSCFGLFSTASAGMSVKTSKKKLPPIEVLGVPHSLDEVKQPLIKKEE